MIIAAAVRLSESDGRFWVGKFHSAARDRAWGEVNCGRNEFECGFIDDQGNWLTREEAYKVAKSNGQLISEPTVYGAGILDSECIFLSLKQVELAISLQNQRKETKNEIGRGFELETILSIITGATSVDIVQIYDLVKYVFPDASVNNYRTYIPKLKAHILLEHPRLHGATYNSQFETSYEAWVISQKLEFGETLAIKPVTYCLEPANKPERIPF